VRVGQLEVCTNEHDLLEEKGNEKTQGVGRHFKRGGGKLLIGSFIFMFSTKFPSKGREEEERTRKKELD